MTKLLETRGLNLISNEVTLFTVRAPRGRELKFTHTFIMRGFYS